MTKTIFISNFIANAVNTILSDSNITFEEVFTMTKHYADFAAEQGIVEAEISRYHRWGIDYPSAIADYRPQIKYTKRQTCHSMNAKKRGYILGDHRRTAASATQSTTTRQLPAPLSSSRIWRQTTSAYC